MRHTYGYRVCDGIALPPPPEHSARVICFQRYYEAVERRPVQVSLGPIVAGLAPPHPDKNHGPTLLQGCLSRFAADPPKASRTLLRSLRRFVRKYVRDNLVPLEADYDLSVERWLEENTTYSAKRKEELLKVAKEHNMSITQDDYVVKLFCKSETYLKYKHARGINSRTDAAKCYFGPAFHAIEKRVYEIPAFIKKIPVRARPKYIMDMLGKYPGPFKETDYSQFEKHFVPHVMASIEMELYSWMLRNFPERLAHIKRAMLGTNRCTNINFRLDIKGRRMSGEMCTSLGNGFSNLMLLLFTAYRKGGKAEGVVEGDDALFYSDVPVSTEDFRELGFTIKMLEHEHLLRSSFCGMVCSRDLATMTDPLKVLLNIGWTHSPMMNSPALLPGLLKAKALSLAYEHPQCPILFKLSEVILRHTGFATPRFESNWYEASLNAEVMQFADETKLLMRLGPSSSTREDFAEHFGISVACQLAVEAELEGWSGGELDGPNIRGLFDETFNDCRDYYERFASRYGINLL